MSFLTTLCTVLRGSSEAHTDIFDFWRKLPESWCPFHLTLKALLSVSRNLSRHFLLTSRYFTVDVFLVHLRVVTLQKSKLHTRKQNELFLMEQPFSVKCWNKTWVNTNCLRYSYQLNNSFVLCIRYFELLNLLLHQGEARIAQSVITTRLRAGWPGFIFRQGHGVFLRDVCTGSRAHLASYLMGTGEGFKGARAWNWPLTST